MPILRVPLLVVLFALGAMYIPAQNLGSLEVAGRVKIPGQKEQFKLKRKRFYLFRGGLSANKALIDRLKTAEFTSRDCFYCQMKASPEYIAWLKAQDCESPYCRRITADDTAKVPEFQAAYQKSLKQFGGKPAIAMGWLTTNLAPSLRDGFYRQRKSLLDTILGGVKPEQSSMTDSVSVFAIFIDIPLKAAETGGKSTETFLISNLVPFEIGSKSYLWACETEIGSNKKAKLQLLVPEDGKPARKCEVIIKDLPVCTAGSCSQK